MPRNRVWCGLVHGQHVSATARDEPRHPPSQPGDIPIRRQVWITTTQELAGRVLKDSETFTCAEGRKYRRAAMVDAGAHPRVADNMLTMDEPHHTRLRGIVDEAFRRRAILDMEPRILAIADELAGELFAEGSPADLVDRYARRLPLSVICELLGCRRQTGRSSLPGPTALRASPALLASWGLFLPWRR